MKKLVIYAADTNVAKKILFGTSLTESVGLELNKEVDTHECKDNIVNLVNFIKINK